MQPNLQINDTRTPEERAAEAEPRLIAALEQVPGKLQELEPEARDVIIIVSTMINELPDVDGPNIPKMLVSQRLLGRPKINPAAAWALGDGLQIAAYDRAEYASNFDVEYARGRWCRTTGIDWADWLSRKPGTVVCLLASFHRFLGGRRVRLEAK